MIFPATKQLQANSVLRSKQVLLIVVNCSVCLDKRELYDLATQGIQIVFDKQL